MQASFTRRFLILTALTVLVGTLASWTYLIISKSVSIGALPGLYELPRQERYSHSLALSKDGTYSYRHVNNLVGATPFAGSTDETGAWSTTRSAFGHYLLLLRPTRCLINGKESPTETSHLSHRLFVFADNGTPSGLGFSGYGADLLRAK